MIVNNLGKLPSFLLNYSILCWRDTLLFFVNKNEIYQYSQTNKWSKLICNKNISNLIHNNMYSTLIYNDQIIVVYSEKSLKRFKILSFDLITLTWNQVDSKNQIPSYEEEYSCFLYENSIILLQFCSRRFTNVFYKFDLLKRKWNQLEFHKIMPCSRVNYTGYVYNHSLYLHGGICNCWIGFQTLNEIWKLDLKNNIWTKIFIHNSPYLHSHSLTIFDDKIYMIGSKNILYEMNFSNCCIIERNSFHLNENCLKRIITFSNRLLIFQKNNIYEVVLYNQLLQQNLKSCLIQQTFSDVKFY